MMQKSGSCKVSIFGDQYTVKTDESSDCVLQAAALVDSTMKEIARGSSLDAKSIAILASLRIAHQMMAEKNVHQRNEELISLIDQELAKIGLSV